MVGGRDPKTVSSSANRRPSIAGCWERRYRVQVSALAVVSWPASKSVMISSRSCSLLMPPPSAFVIDCRAMTDKIAVSAARSPSLVNQNFKDVGVEDPRHAGYGEAERQVVLFHERINGQCGDEAKLSINE